MNATIRVFHGLTKPYDGSKCDIRYQLHLKVADFAGFVCF